MKSDLGICRFKVAVNDALLMRMLNRPADRGEHRQAFANGRGFLPAIVR
jgi:hypothetical protein